MRILLIADVHANWQALLSLQRAEQKPDAVLFAGDAVGYGPDPAECVKWLLANTTAAVKGNHDVDAATTRLDGVPPELSDAAHESLWHTQKAVARAELNQLAQLPLTNSYEAGGVKFFLVHGTPLEPLIGQLNAATASEAELQMLFAEVEAQVIVLGHTHLPAIRKFGNKTIINPGSLGQPRYGIPDATYAVWHDGRVQIHHLHYDHHAVAHKVRLLPFSPEALEQLTTVLETGMF